MLPEHSKQLAKLIKLAKKREQVKRNEKGAVEMGQASQMDTAFSFLSPFGGKQVCFDFLAGFQLVVSSGPTSVIFQGFRWLGVGLVVAVLGVVLFGWWFRAGGVAGFESSYGSGVEQTIEGESND